MVAVALRCNEATAWRWTQQLEETGYLQARSHYTTMTTSARERRTVVDGTLYASKPTTAHQDLNRQYRNLDADRAAGLADRGVSRPARRAGAKPENENSVPEEEK